MRYQVVVLNKDKIDDFAKERNRLLSNAKKDWVLFLDSDEKINNLSFDAKDEISGYQILRKNYFLDKYVGSEWLIRLGKKSAGRWERKVHETWRIKGKVNRLPKTTFISHHTANNLRQYISKINNYSSLHAIANKQEGKRPSLFKIIIFPQLKFIRSYISGRSVVFSLMQSFHSYLSWSKLYFLHF